MSREIKFRAWDKEVEGGLMVYSDMRNKSNYVVNYDFIFDKNGKVVCIWHEDYDDSFGYPASNGGELDNIMQYTGLKDKNGKEIYEGDIVDCKILSSGRTHYTAEYIAVVEDDTCNPCFVLKQSNGFVEYDFVKCDLMQLEVIGNRYEHPNLLGGVDK